MSNLIKEAIADAKAVREMAVKQAKAALEEAFAPQVDAIISRRLQTEEDDEEELEEPEEVEVEEAISPAPGVELGTDNDHEEADENSGLTEDADTSDIGTSDNKEPSKDSSEETTEDPDGEVTVKPDHETAKESELTEELEDLEEDVDLAQIVKELEDETSEFEEDEFETEDEFEAEEGGEAESFEGEEAEEEFEAEPEEEEELELEIEDDLADEEGEVDYNDEEEEELDLEAIIGDEDEEDPEMEVESLRQENANLKAKLGEAMKAVRIQKDRLNEINILNAKLLFTNKVFGKYNLDDSSKIKVIENFDRAKNVREVKLIFATLMENMKADERKVSSKAQRLMEGASKTIKSTKVNSQQIISEDAEVKSRVHKLMGLNKK